MKKLTIPLLMTMLFLPLLQAGVPKRTETATLTFAPNVPPPVKRKKPALVYVNFETTEKNDTIMEGFETPTIYPFWTFNGSVPGPFIRVREGDTIEVRMINPKTSKMVHNVDFHAVTGPGGGAVATSAAPGETKVARFKMIIPGLFTYHCAAPPVADHIANGMYGLILVEPKKGLPKVDKEFYVMQSEFYTKGDFGAEGPQEYDPKAGLAEHPTYVVFNGKVGALQNEGALKAEVGDDIRIYFGNIGPNLVSSFHVIGEMFDRVYREGGLLDATRNAQTTVVPAGSASTVEFHVEVPGNYTLVDHSIFRIQKGALGILSVSGPDNHDIYHPLESAE